MSSIEHLFNNNDFRFVDLLEGRGLDQLEDTDEPNIFQHSKYYHDEDFIDLLKTKQNQLTILSLNCQSINAKFEQLKIYIEKYNSHCSNNTIHVICLQETWLTAESDLSLLQLNGYNLISTPRSCSAHSGLAIYLAEHLSYEVIDVTSSDIWDGQFMKIYVDVNNEKHLVIGNIYHPPRPAVDNIMQFNREISSTLSQFRNEKHVLLTGDFNINLLRSSENSHIDDFLENMITNSYIPKITVPTRLTQCNGTLIDNFFLKMSQNFSYSIAGVLRHQISDHLPYFIIIDYFSCPKPKSKLLSVNLCSRNSFENFKKDLQDPNTMHNLQQIMGKDTDESYNQFNSILTPIINKHFPRKKVRFKKHKHKKSKWITFGILKSISYRDKMYSKFKNTPENDENYNARKINLATYNKILKQCIRQAKCDYFHKCFQNFRHDISKTWKTINDILNRTDNKKDFPKHFVINEAIVKDRNLIANEFNKYFVEIGTRLAEDIDRPSGVTFESYFNHLNVTSEFKFQTVNEEIVLKVIDNLKPKTSYGTDMISNKLLKHVKNELLNPITNLINQTLSTGKFPKLLKIAKISPIFKKGDDTLLSNYRPVSVLPSVSKVFEKVIYNQIYEYFTDKKLLYNSQYGFRKNHSTEYAAMELIDRVIKEMDLYKIPINIYLDLSKAFDTLDHNILLSKLSFYGINGRALELIKSYLSDRFQFVMFEDIRSNLMEIKCGVPQGSILGPLLFIIYMNDLQFSSTQFNMVIYADDTALCTTLNLDSTNQKKLNAELKLINQWLQINKLSLNVSKTKAMLFHTPQRKVTYPTLKIDNHKIEFVSKFNYLGIIIDENLNWNVHIETLTKKISKTIGIINKLKNQLPTETLLNIYNALVASYLNYGIAVWGWKLEKLLKLQKKAVRAITRSAYTAHSSPLFKKLNILNVIDMRALCDLKFCYKYVKKQLPKYFYANEDENECTHEYFTRQRDDLRLPAVNHDFAKQSITYHFPFTFNEMDDDYKTKFSTHTFEGFKFHVKRKFIESYESTCYERNCPRCGR